MKMLKVLTILAFCSLLLIVCLTQSAKTSPLTNGVVTLGFDDGLETAYQYAWPLMQQRGMIGTFYVISGDVGKTGCLSKSELSNLQAGGNEIASHSVTHTDFTTLSTSQIQQECLQSKTTLQGFGLTVNNFAYPFGAGNSTTDNIVKNYYHSARYGWNIMTLPYNNFNVYGWTNYDNDASTKFAALKQVIDNVYSQKGWTILYFHSVEPTNDYNTVTSTQTFTQILDYIQSKNIQVLTVEQALTIVSTPSIGTATVEMQPFGLTMTYTVQGAFTYTAPDSVTAWNKQWTFQNWMDGTTARTRTLQPNTTYTINYS